MPKVLVITPYFFPHAGGSQEYIVNMYSELMKKNSHLSVDVLCYNTNDAPAHEIYKGFSVHRVQCLELLPGQFAIPNPIDLFKTLKKLRKNNYICINSHTRFFDNSWWTPAVSKWLGTKSLLTDHCASHPNHQSWIVRSITKVVDNVFARTVAHSYWKIHTVSNATAQFLENIGGPKSTVVHGGVDIQEINSTKPCTTVPNSNTEILHKDIVVSFVGRFIATKGPEKVAQIAASVIAANPRIRVILAGDGPLLPALQKKYSHIDRLHFTGNISREEVYALLKRSDILVHPSTHHEGFPTVLLEAAAARTALVASTAGGTRELIQNQHMGYSIDPQSVDEIRAAVEELANNTRLRKSVASAAYTQVATHFSQAIVAEKFAKAFLSNT